MIRLPIAPRSARRAGLLAAAAAGVLALGACHSKPTGQVAATVDGNEVTLTEINSELQSMQVPKNADSKLVQQAALQRIIERKLLANAARDDNLDQSPEFVVRRQQLEDALLVQLLSQKVARGLKTPTATDIDKFAAANPSSFAGREIMTVDQLRFAPPADNSYLKQLSQTHTLADVMALLDKLNIKYQRGSSQIDTVQVPPQMVAQIKKLPAGEPFVVPAGNNVVVSVVTDTKPAPLPAEATRPLATNGIRNQQLGDALKARLKAEQDKAKVQYQPGFAPPANMPGAIPAAK